MILCVVFAKSVDERWTKCVKVIKYLRSKLVPLVKPEEKRKEKGRLARFVDH